MRGADCKWQDRAVVSSVSRRYEEAAGLQSEMMMKKIRKKKANKKNTSVGAGFGR